MKLMIKILLASSMIVLSACFEDPGTDIVWGNDAYLEIDRGGQPNPFEGLSYERKNDGVPYPYSLQINIMGRPRNTPTTVNFEIAASSTAIAGVHYNKITAGNSVTIPAGELTTTIDIEVLADNIEPNEVWNIDIALTGGDLPLSNYSEVTLGLSITCPLEDDFTGTYMLETLTNGIFDTPTFTDGEVTVVSTGTYDRQFAVAPYPAFGAFAPMTFKFTLVCDKVVVAPAQATGVGCGTSTVLGPGSSEGSYTRDDDTVITVIMADDVGGASCGEEVPAASFKLTKVL